MRGKVSDKISGIQSTRITPAYAGKSLQRGFHGFGYQDHPRLCGEKDNGNYAPENLRGSPPPMRGKALNLLYQRLSAGITPAYAGKSCMGSAPETAFEDHPRLCGEKFQHTKYISYDPGSPPPMRGKAVLKDAIVRSSRITPAYAGKRMRCRKTTLGVWDHPRLCGEKLVEETGDLLITGSPPPMRGKD